MASQILDNSTVFFNCLFQLIWKPKLRIIGTLSGNPRVSGGFPSESASNAENLISWRHRVMLLPVQCCPSFLRTGTFQKETLVDCLLTQYDQSASAPMAHVCSHRTERYFGYKCLKSDKWTISNSRWIHHNINKYGWCYTYLMLNLC